MTHSTEPPPASTGPYKSRLFNVLNRQRIVWGDRLAQAGRSLQIAAVWGGQMVLYPLYLLTQFGRGLSLRLESAVSGKAALPKTKAELPPCDRPIKQTLEQLQDLAEDLTVVTTATLALNPAPEYIRSIASDRQTHRLVVVNGANQSQDKLSLEQQQQLRQRMLWEMADYSHQHYLLKVKANQYRIPQQFTSDVNVWTPVQRFWQFMRWLQGSPIAIAANVFGEAELTLPPPTHPLALTPVNLPDWDDVVCTEHPFVIQVDGAIADLEQRQTQFNQNLGQWWQTQNLEPTSPLSKTRQVFQRGLDFLLGTSDLMTVTSDPPGVKSSAWLSWEYLSNPSQEDYNAAVPPEQTFVEAEMVIDLALNQPDTTTTSPKPIQTTPTAELVRSPQPESATSPSPALTHPTDAPASPDYQPDWIEVPSQAVGYETHFLERVLNGFDSCMALFEELVITLWQWGKQLAKRLLPHD